MIYIIVGILILLLLYKLFSNSNKNKLLTNKSYIFKSNTFSTSNNSISGKKNLYCNDTIVRPYMFRNLSKEYVSNNNIDWNIQQVDNNKYKLLLSDRYCAYNFEDSICLYELEDKIKTHNNNEPGCKKKACSIDSILETVEFNPLQSEFRIEPYNNGYKIITSDDKYVCFEDTKLIISNSFNSTCIFHLK